MKELVANGDFSSGNRKFDSDYVYINDRTGKGSDGFINYHVNVDPSTVYGASPDWASFGDHTTGDGKMMICDGGSGDVWSEGIDLVAGKSYTFTLWARASTSGSNGTGSPTQLQFFADGHAIGTSLTLPTTDAGGWQELKFNYQATSASSHISIQDLNTDHNYNDFCLDDISITKGKGSSALHPDVFASGHLDPHPSFASLHALDHLAIA